MLLRSWLLPEREGGGGAPTFFGVWVWVARAEKSRAGAVDRPAGALWGWARGCGVPRRGTPKLVLGFGAEGCCVVGVL